MSASRIEYFNPIAEKTETWVRLAILRFQSAKPPRYLLAGLTPTSYYHLPISPDLRVWIFVAYSYHWWSL